MSALKSAPDRPRPVLSVLIVNFNSTDVLRDCLDALAASTISHHLETIVVDNASSDIDVEGLRTRYPWVAWLPQTQNTTYTGGNNIAFAHSSAEFVVMLNPDTRLEPKALERAIQHMATAPDLVALGAYLIGPDGQLQQYYRRLPLLQDIPVMLFEPIFRRTARGRRFLMMDEQFGHPTPVQNPPGAFILLRRSAAGGRLLDPAYFNFVSDMELCERLNRAGRVIVFPDVRCHHLRAGAGVGTRDPGERLRLYHDFTWGLRRYFSERSGALGRAGLGAMLGIYWLTRLARTAVAHPRYLPRGIRVGLAALAGHPPSYSSSGRSDSREPMGGAVRSRD